MNPPLKVSLVLCEDVWRDSIINSYKTRWTSWWFHLTRHHQCSLSVPNAFFFPFIFISWRLITSQHCSGFCNTLTWISHGVTSIPHPDPPSHLPLHLIPLGLPSAPGPSTCLMHPTWAGDLLDTSNITSLGFQGGDSSKDPACQCRRLKRHRFNPWVGKIPWRRKWQPTPVSLPGEFQGQRSLVDYSP